MSPTNKTPSNDVLHQLFQDLHQVQQKLSESLLRLESTLVGLQQPVPARSDAPTLSIEGAEPLTPRDHSFLNEKASWLHADEHLPESHQERDSEA